jgi:long-chain fatty acid transport protein
MGRHITLLALVWCAITNGATTQAFAGSGFTLRSQSATTLGSAQAGMTAGSEDISLMVFNPAALAQGSGREISFGGTGLFTGGQFGLTSATTVLGTPIAGGNGGNNGTQVLIPNLYGAIDLPGNFRVGLAVTSLYGLGAYWNNQWAGRYYAQNSQLITQDLEPVLSYRVNRSLVFGIGIDIEYAQVKTTNALDLGTVDQTLFGGAFGGVPAGSDGALRIRAQSWTVGFVAGAQYEPIDGTRLGLSYHSSMRQSLSGTANFAAGGPVGLAVAAATGAFISTDVQSDINLPSTVMLGVQQAIGSDWMVMADVQWMGWHTLKGLQASFANPLQPPITTVLNWHDSWFFTVGAKYRLSNAISIRFGAAYDQSPTRDSTRTPAIPDATSYWASLGLEYRLTENTKFDLAYGHIFVVNGTVGLQATSPGNIFRGNLAGAIRAGSVDYLALQGTFRF